MEVKRSEDGINRTMRWRSGGQRTDLGRAGWAGLPLWTLQREEVEEIIMDETH